MNLKILSFNIHKGFSPLKRKYTLAMIRSSLVESDADVALLQEVHGLHPNFQNHEQSPLEILADEFWPHFRHGVNSVYSSNFHGNAIMSKYPILNHDNIDISTNSLERRGLLWAHIGLPNGTEVDLFCTHLNLFLAGQIKQIKKVAELVESRSLTRHRVLAGDFNDWSFYCDRYLKQRSEFQSIGRVKTFPSLRPVLSLDRIYFQGFHCSHFSAINAFKHSSDHLPLLAQLEVTN